MGSARLVLEGQLCPSGYVLQSDSSLSVCVCNEDIPEVLLCKDDQDTVVIMVRIDTFLFTNAC